MSKQKATATVNTAVNNTTNTNTQKEEVTMMTINTTLEALEAMTLNELKKFASANNLPVKKAGKGVTKAVLLESIKPFLAPAEQEETATQETVNAILADAKNSASPEQDEEYLDRLVEVLPNQNPDTDALRKALKADLWAERDYWSAPVKGPNTTTTTITQPQIEKEEEIMTANYRPISLLETIYTTIWEVLPSRGQTILEGFALVFGWLFYVLADVVDIGRTWLPIYGRKFLRWITPKVVYALAYGKKMAPVVALAILDGIFSLVWELKGLWNFRDELLKEVA